MHRADQANLDEKILMSVSTTVIQTQAYREFSIASRGTEEALWIEVHTYQGDSDILILEDELQIAIKLLIDKYAIGSHLFIQALQESFGVYNRPRVKIDVR